jgi:hypothetical protein
VARAPGAGTKRLPAPFGGAPGRRVRALSLAWSGPESGKPVKLRDLSDTSPAMQFLLPSSAGAR